MTDKEKALAYDKLLVKAKQIYDKENDVLIMHTIEDLFPDLKESEDERIRKHLISLVKNWDKDGIASKYTSNPNDIKQILAWLEKQSTPAKLSEEGLDDKLKSLRSQPKQGWSEEDEKRLRDTINTIIVYKEDTNVRCCQSELNDCIANINWLKSLKERATWKPAPEMKSPEEISSEEFHDESGTSTDNPKPRFKPGEWIAHNEANFVFQVVSVGSNAYEVVNPDGYTKSIPFKNEGDYHRWTIQEAKDGDLVVEDTIPDYSSPFIAIFKAMGPYPFDTFSSHCFIDFNGNFNEGAVGHDPSNLHPATKEQRDILFQGMEKAGYEWLEETKELKKIGPKPFEAEHGKYYYCIKDYFCGGRKQASKGDVIQALRGLPIMGLKDASEYFLPVNHVMCGSTWSDEDKQYLLVCKNALAKYQTTDKWDANIISRWLENKLRSFRPQNRWKPSKEQLRELENVFSPGTDSWDEDILRELYKQLKQL